MDKARCIKALASVLAVFSLSISFSDTAAFAVDRSQLDWIEQQLETLSLQREESQAKVDELKDNRKGKAYRLFPFYCLSQITAVSCESLDLFPMLYKACHTSALHAMRLYEAIPAYGPRCTI